MLKAATTKLKKKKKTTYPRSNQTNPQHLFAFHRKLTSWGGEERDPVMQQGNTCHVHNA